MYENRYDTATETTLSVLALESGVNKSKLRYYVGHGILVPIRVEGKLEVFDRTKSRMRIADLRRFQSMGWSIKKIKRELGIRSKKVTA